MRKLRRILAMTLATALVLITPAEAFATEVTPTVEVTPTAAPTEAPVTEPTDAPAEEPTEAPEVEAPTAEPTEEPAASEPTEEPTEAPEVAPTEAPTEIPEATEAPTATPEGEEAVSASPEASEVPTETPAAEVTPSASPEGTPSASPRVLKPRNSEEMILNDRTTNGKDWAERTGRIVNGSMDVDFELELPADEIDFSSDSIENVKASVSVPASYDARNYGMVSSVKNQNPWGTCWAFSAVACAEAAYLRLNGSEANLSETHLAEFFYSSDNNISGPDGGLAGDKTAPIGDTEPQMGGNSLFTTWGLATWAGVANEATHSSLVYPTNASSSGTIAIADNYAYNDAMHLENAYWLSTKNPNSIKQAIMEYGAVGISYYYDWWCDSDYYKEDMNPYYNGPAVYYNPYESSTNHAVTIVGWDDNFDKNNFKYTYDNQYYYEYYDWDYLLPKKNGAWLIKNSWGTGIGDDGYFWISYEDASIKDDRTVFVFDYANADNYDHNYQYDGSAGIQTFTSGGTTTAAAVYTASGPQRLDAVGVGVASTDTNYTVSIYTDLTDPSDPESGTLQTTQTGKTSFTGFYTIELDEQVLLKNGTKFSVVVKASRSGTSKLFYDTSYINGGWINFTANVNPGETFCKENNVWEDAAYFPAPGTFRIKAYTQDYDFDKIAKKDLTIREDMVPNLENVVYTGGEITPNPVITYGEYVLVNGLDYTLAYENNQKVGIAKVTINGKGSYAGTVTKTFEILPATMAKEMVSGADAKGQIEVVYTGTAYTGLKLALGSYVLKEGVDYTLKYNKTPLEAGSYTANITGIGNFKGNLKAIVKITPVEMNTCNVALNYSSADYTGANVTPGVTIKVDGIEVAASNYSVKYKENKNAGTATVTITGKKSLKGTVERQFTITPAVINESSCTITVANAKYTGDKLMPKVTVKYGTKTLSNNKDYMVAYSNNTDAGTGRIRVDGIGNYSGSVTKTFTITPSEVKASAIKAELRGGSTKGVKVLVSNKEVAAKNYTAVIKKAGTQTTVAQSALQVGEKYDVEITLKGNYSGSTVLKNQECKMAVEGLTVALQDTGAVYTYTGKALKPKVVVKNGSEVIATKNYTVSYSDNINAGTEGKITVTGKGSLSGSKTINFTIQKKNLDDTFKDKASVVTDIKAQTYTGSAITPKVMVKGLKEGADKDFTVTYTNNTNVAYANGAVAKNAKITVALSSNYTITDTSKLNAYFQINPAKISSVKTTNMYYLGGQTVKTNVMVMAGKVEVPDTAYTVTYADNYTQVTSGAKITVAAKANGNFTGEKTATYKISKQALSAKDVTITGLVDTVTYTGKAIEQPNLKLYGANGIIDASQYKVTYSKNINAGTASVTIAANSDSMYSGKVTLQYKIEPAQLSTIMNVGILPSKTYDGKAKTFTKTELEAALKEKGTGSKIPSGSYKIAYSNNMKAGTATMTLTGSKNYTGTAIVSFNINKKAIGVVDVDCTKTVYGVPGYPSIKKIADGKTNLVRGVDYTVSYVNATQKGIAAMKITGIGNYAGTKTIYYTIK